MLVQPWPVIIGIRGIGFVLTDYDPFTFIDLDDTKATPKQCGTSKIFNEFESYAERSPSGNGLHIIVKGKLQSGRRRSFVEIYSSARYMTMTGGCLPGRSHKRPPRAFASIVGTNGTGSERRGLLRRH